ncbi:hypothetical protein [Mangrovimonas sp. YM274]|uniref:hypothetical protein n=1 Tax=Mangrovimonas sp. YM274 TaxID=3070660 RepID=UPI0027DC61FF|nr:hypothetical protein [Mangrovimonas sp. YM274]WMI69087.1 hypothetical protein RBH95_01640 [Mangrovimonas sp. YM274]
MALILFVLVSFMCSAQGDATPVPPQPAPQGTIPPGLPIDGLISVCFIVASVYGVRVKRKQKK